MTDRVKALSASSVTIHVESRSGYSSTENFDSARGGELADVTLMNAVDELHRMLLIGGIKPETLEFRFKEVLRRVGGTPPEVQVKITKNEGYPGPHFQD